MSECLFCGQTPASARVLHLASYHTVVDDRGARLGDPELWESAYVMVHVCEECRWWATKSTVRNHTFTITPLGKLGFLRQGFGFRTVFTMLPCLNNSRSHQSAAEGLNTLGEPLCRECLATESLQTKTYHWLIRKSENTLSSVEDPATTEKDDVLWRAAVALED